MTLVDKKMEQAASDLHHAVATVPIPSSPQQRPASPPIRRLSPPRVMAIAFISALLVGLPALLLRPGNDTLQSPDGPESAAPGQPESSEPATIEGFPRLVVDVSPFGDWDLATVIEDDTRDDNTSSHLFAYADARGELLSPRIWIVTRHSGTDFFRGEAYLEGGWSEVPVDTGTAYALDGDSAPFIIWDEGSGAEGPAVFAHGLNVDQSVLIDVLNNLTESEAGWEAAYLPEGLTETYAGPERAATSLLALIWIDRESTGEIALELIDAGSHTLERNLYDILNPGNSEASNITNADVRGNPAVRIDSEASRTVVYQWMETPTVMARLMVQGSGIDPDRVVESLRTVDQPTWDATLESAITSNDPDATPTTTTIVGLNVP